jgi:hypothetical protein
MVRLEIIIFDRESSNFIQIIIRYSLFKIYVA